MSQDHRTKDLHRIPTSTYRLQMQSQFGFGEATAILPYLRRLGITDCYTSPLLKAQVSSTHGYDITDHNQINPELGPESAHAQFMATLRELTMGHLLDFVPNHMGIDPSGNLWWHDVLENGPSSPYSRFFDIDWKPLKPELENKVLLPILGDQYGTILERGDLHLIFEDGAIELQYGEFKLPLNPRRTPDVLKLNLDTLQKQIEATPELREFLSILTELSNLPTTIEQDAERIEERQREKEVARERLSKLFRSSPPIRQHILNALEAFNGMPGKPESFDALHRLLEAQAYRLAYWKTASHEINYRRFFDINQLAGLRMERPEVFEATHRRLLAMIHEGSVTGLRLDHPDGLYDPAAYYDRLQNSAGPLYVVAEKILSAGESLRKSQSIDGTSGYDFLNLVNHLFIEARHAAKMKDIYQRFIGRPVDSQEECYRSKKLIMSTSMASELNVLAHLLNQISETNRHWRDFTLDSLRVALREVVACFPVYRTYISGPDTSPSDELTITKAVARAKDLNPAMESSIFDFVRSMLAPKPAPDLPAEEYQRRLEFAMKFQQYTAPVQAKGVEDTAFYRYAVLLSVNEVGGDLERFGVSVSDFHQANLERLHDWPGSLLATATHDTKRGEDARVRLDILSELPEEWEQAIFQWNVMNRKYKTEIDGRLCPDLNDEYLLYQTLAGAWSPMAGSPEAISLPLRMREYVIKATREAKRYTSWVRPNEAYEKATLDFLDRILTDKAPGSFLLQFEPFILRIASDGMINSLAQVALKMASPGVPDFYQGTELWDWSLVDPDNRRAVDFDHRQKMLTQLTELYDGTMGNEGHDKRTSSSENHGASATLERVSDRRAGLRQMIRHWEDGQIKLFITTQGLRYRDAHPELFLQGSYIPLEVAGENADHLVAFAREWGSEKMVIVVPRLVARFKLKTRLWESTRIILPESWKITSCQNIFSAEEVAIERIGPTAQLCVDNIFPTLPVAWLHIL